MTSFIASTLAALVVCPLLASATHEYPDCESGPLASNAVCNTTLPARERAQAFIDALTFEEKINITNNWSPGVERLGISPYNWWGEALHGLASAPGTNFNDSGEWSYATSFPQPITMAAAFDDDLIYAVADIISTEARAYNNANMAGLDFWTPNINPFRDPRWGRGQETPGEDTYVVRRYIENYVTAMQGGHNLQHYKTIATCKHYSAYDMEFWQGNTRYGFDAIVSNHDLSSYYMQPFVQCARDTKVASIMCSYNAVNGVPQCADEYMIETVLRGHWNWTADENYIVTDCTSVQNIFTDHEYTDTRQQTVAAAIKSGADLECGFYFPTFLESTVQQGLLDEADIDRSLLRMYTALTKSGYFDPPDHPWRSLGWEDVATDAAETLALKSAEEGLVLLKNDGTLPITISEDRNYTILMFGSWINATSQLQGIYAGPARTLVSPWMALNNVSNVNIQVAEWYESPLKRVDEVQPDLILYIGATNEGAEETTDRNTGIPTVVAHMGEQVDDSVFFNEPNISAVIWGGYPGMFGGTALVNLLLGTISPAGRMPITQYPESYAKQVSMTDMNMRPDNKTGNPGRTYKWYDGAVVEFGFGLHYTNFSSRIAAPSATSFDIQSLIDSCDQSSVNHVELCPFLPSSSSPSSLAVNVTNTGARGSDFVTLAFVAGEFGPLPRPRKSLVAYQRLFGLDPSASQVARLNVTLGSLSRHDEEGNQILYPGKYRFEVDVPVQSAWEFELTGNEVVLDRWPQRGNGTHA
jgi:beta-D-xylosidase 4